MYTILRSQNFLLYPGMFAWIEPYLLQLPYTVHWFMHRLCRWSFAHVIFKSLHAYLIWYWTILLSKTICNFLLSLFHHQMSMTVLRSTRVWTAGHVWTESTNTLASVWLVLLAPTVKPVSTQGLPNLAAYNLHCSEQDPVTDRALELDLHLCIRKLMILQLGIWTVVLLHLNKKSWHRFKADCFLS